MSRSPRILGHSWGRLDVEGIGSFRDAKLFPNDARAWDWRETGTRHVPGIQIADVEELVDAGASVVVLSRGMEQRLMVPERTIRWLEDLGVLVHTFPTPEAITKYNELVETSAVGALIHSTC